MYIIIPVLITVILLFIIIRVIILNDHLIKFFSNGVDSGFKVNEILLLWKLAQNSGLEEPSALFWSIPALDRSISFIINKAKSTNTENKRDTQDFLSRLYAYRTRVELDPKSKRGLKTTKSLEPGQRLRIVLKGKGIFTSKIMHNSRNLVVSLPLKDGRVYFHGKEWVNNPVSVYLWRKNDASYVFDTVVQDSGMFSSQNVLFLAHTENIFRTQKRKSVRCACSIIAQMYVISDKDAAVSQTEEKNPGLKCLLEDISEDGALIRVGGRGVQNMKIKIQFHLGETFIVMTGIIKGVEYIEAKKQSRLHFECIQVNSLMKNAILSYVYNVLPQEQKEMIDAMHLAEQDEREVQESKNTASAVNVIPPETVNSETIEEFEGFDNGGEKKDGTEDTL